MLRCTVRMAWAAVALTAATEPARAQMPSSPVTIPLGLMAVDNAYYRLTINVGINGGTPQLYMFDTGSAPFAAAFNPNTWGGFAGQTSVPTSPFPKGNNVFYCYGGGVDCSTGNIYGNRLQIQSLTIPGASQVLSANPGYAVDAVYQLNYGDKTLSFPSYFSTPNAPPPFRELFGPFYGVFGAGNFTQGTLGGILGQTMVAGSDITQGYVVAANGQSNPASPVNTPQRVNGQTVTVGGQTRAVTACSPCVTVGLTPQMLGQFAPVGPPGASGQAGVIPMPTGGFFNNPYAPIGTQSGNSASLQDGAKFTISLAPPGTTTPAVTSTKATLLDTGTPSNSLSNSLDNSAVSSGGNVIEGVTLTATATTGTDSHTPVNGLVPSTSVMTNGATPNTYDGSFEGSDSNILGIGFFLQNSVMYDLSNNAIAYTPFFVTDVPLSTTGGPLIVDGNNVPLGLAGAISGTGGVHIKDGGQLQLSATNTYTGHTRIDLNGLLNIAGPGSIAASSGVTNDGTFDISRAWNPVSIRDLGGSGKIYLGAQSLSVTNADNGTFSGTIADTGGSYDVAGGSLSLTGGRLTLTGANTYTGGTAVTGGAILRINADAALGNTSGGLILNNGMLAALSGFTVARQVTLGTGGGAFDTNGFDLTLATAVTGAGGLAKHGPGILTLSGANSYAGGTTVNAGTLRLAPGASVPTTGPLAVNGGIFDLNGNNLAIGSLSGLGGRIELGNGTLTVAEQGNTSFAGILAGTGGLTMQGPGALSLAGANTYTGPTNVTGGRLAINGSITSDVTVGAGGNLGGSGTISGTVTNSGIVSPGNSIGTLNVVGALTQNAGSAFQVETSGAGQADRINVSGAPGTATIAGGTVTLTGASGVYAPSTTYTILNATGGVTGTFANANSLFPFLQPSLSYDANNVFLTLKPGGFGAGAGTANQAAVGRVLDASVAGSTGDLATVIGTMATYTTAQGQAAMSAIGGQNYSGFGTANLGGGLLFMNGLGQQMSLARGGFGGGTRVALAQACETSLADADACDGAASPWSLWGSALGGTGRVAGTANAGTLTYNAGGFATGVDYRFDPRFLAGIGVGFSSGNQWASGFSGQGTTSSYQATLYASFVQGAFYLDGMAGYGYSDNWMTRQIALPNLAVRTAQGRTGANQFLGQVEAGYRIGLHEPAALSVTPFARFQGMTNSQYGFTESGAGALSLTVAPQTTGSARSVLGAEFAGAFGPEGREKLAVQMRLGWAHEYANTARPVTASFAGAPGANFTVFGAAPQRDTATLSLAANTAVAQGVSLYARYDGEVGNGISSHALNGGFRMTW